MINATILADSVGPHGIRLVTYELTYPRFIHSELLTHRMLSRNAASSRAIPVERMIAAVVREPARPVRWAANQPGMQSGPTLTAQMARCGNTIWDDALTYAIASARSLAAHGVHKSIVNRLLEPFAHITTIVTATEWANFFRQRISREAQPEFHELAWTMGRLYRDHQPIAVAEGGWHLPYITDSEQALAQPLRIKVSVARCARVSYARTHEERAIKDDMALCERLKAAGHWSPFEHAAVCLDDAYWSRNLRGWRSARSLYEHEERITMKGLLLDQLLTDERPEWLIDADSEDYA